MFLAAAVAFHAYEAVLGPPAAQMVLELGQYEACQRALEMLLCSPPCRQMPLDNEIERIALRLMSLVAVVCVGHPVTGNSFHRTLMVVGLDLLVAGVDLNRTPLNGAPALLMSQQGVVHSTVQIDVREGRIPRLYVMRNQKKLLGASVAKLGHER